MNFSELEIKSGETLIEILLRAGVKSKTKARRLILDGAIEIDGVKLMNPKTIFIKKK